MAAPAVSLEHLHAQIRMLELQAEQNAARTAAPYGSAMGAPQVGAPAPTRITASAYAEQILQGMRAKNSAGALPAGAKATPSVIQPLNSKDIVPKYVRFEWRGTLEQFENDEAARTFTANAVPMHGDHDLLVPVESRLVSYRNPLPVAVAVNFEGTPVNRQVVGARAVKNDAVLEPFTHVPVTVDQVLFQRPKGQFNVKLLRTWDGFDKATIDATVLERNDHMWVLTDTSPVVQITRERAGPAGIHPNILSRVPGFNLMTLDAGIARQSYQMAVDTVAALPFHDVNKISGVISRCDGESFTSEEGIRDSSPSSDYKMAQARGELHTVSATVELLSMCWKRHASGAVRPKE